MATVTHDEQLSWERRLGPWAGAAALVAVVLQIVSFVVQLPVLKDVPASDDPNRHQQTLLNFDKHKGVILPSSLLQAAAYFFAAAALYYLFRATRYRREELAPILRWLLVIAPVLLLAAAIVNYVALHDVVDRFIESGPRTDARAKHLLDDGRSVAGGAIGFGGTIALAFSFVMISLNAMRAGLLSRFMGILGIIVGALIVLPLLPTGIPVVQLFWLSALAGLFMGRWPGGRGPAWETGLAEPWPTAAERQGLEPPEEPAPAPAEPEPSSPRPASRKRKKKKRR